MTMCEEIEGLLKINMNKVNDESHQIKKVNILGEDIGKIELGRSRQEEK